MKKWFCIIFILLSLSVLGQQAKEKSSNDIEILGLTVTRHYVSGVITNTDRDEVFNESYNPGALIKFFIRNNSNDTLFPEVKFNGRSGTELLDAKTVSYCNTPDIRKSQTLLNWSVPPRSADYYILNVTDSNFFSSGITVEISDLRSNKRCSKTLFPEKPGFYSPRILFTGSDGDKTADRMILYLRNETGERWKVESVKIWRSKPDFRDHSWSETFEPAQADWFGGGRSIAPGDLGGAVFNTGKLPFGEIIVEIKASSGSTERTMRYPIKPLVVDFAFGMGWAERELASSELFCKTVSLLHLNTVNGNANRFFSDSLKASEYKILKFAKLEDVEKNNLPENISRIHAAEHFGEPQFEKKPAQMIYNYYTTYRNSGYPSTLTLSHEPGYNRYAGVVDFPHFDAYRITAPHADRWGAYGSWGEKNVKWGAPLETIGDYMRSLHRISMPSPVAAWTQGISNGWKHRMRPGAGNANPLEMRLQAFEAVSNGALSLYWFNISGENIAGNPSSMSEIRDINREIKCVAELLEQSVPFSHERRFMDIDLDVLAGPGYLLLFAIDLRYKVSENNEFVTAGKRSDPLTFPLPGFIKKIRGVDMITSGGVTKADYMLSEGRITVAQPFDNTALFVVYTDSTMNIPGDLRNSFTRIAAEEKKLNFDPITNSDDLRRLLTELGLPGK